MRKRQVRSWRKTSVLRQPIRPHHVRERKKKKKNSQLSFSKQPKQLTPENRKTPKLSHHSSDRRSRTKKENQLSRHSSASFTPPPPPLNSTARLNPKSEPERVRQKFLVSSASSLFHPLLPLAQISTTPHIEAYRHTSHWIRCQSL